MVILVIKNRATISLLLLCSSIIFCGGDEKRSVNMHHRSLSEGCSSRIVHRSKGVLVSPCAEKQMVYNIVPRVYSRLHTVPIDDDMALFCCCEPALCCFYTSILGSVAGLAWLKYFLDHTAQ